MLHDVFRAQRFPALRDPHRFEPRPEQQRLHRLTVEKKEVFELELDPPLFHEPGGPAVETRHGNEHQARRFQQSPEMRQIRQRIARVLDDIGEDRDVEGGRRQIDAADASLNDALGRKLVIRRANRALGVFDAGHVVATGDGLDQQVAQSRSNLEQAKPAPSGPDTEPRFNGVEVCGRRRAFQPVGLLGQSLMLETAAEKVMFCVDRGQFRIRGLRVAHQQPAPGTPDDRGARVAELIIEMRVSAERARAEARPVDRWRVIGHPASEA